MPWRSALFCHRVISRVGILGYFSVICRNRIFCFLLNFFMHRFTSRRRYWPSCSSGWSAMRSITQNSPNNYSRPIRRSLSCRMRSRRIGDLTGSRRPVSASSRRACPDSARTWTQPSSERGWWEMNWWRRTDNWGLPRWISRRQTNRTRSRWARLFTHGWLFKKMSNKYTCTID